MSDDRESKEEGEKKPSFTVRDRRRIKPEDVEGTGEAEAASDDQATNEAETEAAESEPKATPLGDNAGVYVPTPDEESGPEVGIDFGSFIISLGTSAYVSMGRVDNPETGEKEQDLPAAQQIIDILEMLQEKTEGNLEPEEKQLLGGLIYELKMAFVEASG